MGTSRVGDQWFDLLAFTFCLLGMISVSSCGGSSPEPPPALQTQIESPTPSFAATHSSVLAGKEVGMVVTGKGIHDANRSLQVLEQRIFSFLSSLRDVYDRARIQEPNLLGSVEVQMTIEPSGQISDLRFPASRIVSEKLLAAIFDEMRTWTFPSADDLVQLRYRLLLIPPGIDHASILLWEKHLGTLQEAKHATERLATITPTPPTAPAPRLPNDEPLDTPEHTPEEETASEDGTQWYRVTRPTTLYAAPREASNIVSILRPGTRIRVVGSAGDEWLEVRSVTDRPPGFLPREDAVLESEWIEQ